MYRGFGREIDTDIVNKWGQIFFIGVVTGSVIGQDTSSKGSHYKRYRIRSIFTTQGPTQLRPSNLLNYFTY
jgi:hypothetical protein